MFLAVQDQAWIVAGVILLALPVGYFLDRAIVARYRTRRENVAPTRRTSVLQVLAIWSSISLLVLMIAISPKLWWLWFGLFLVIGYALIAVIIVRRSRGESNQ